MYLVNVFFFVYYICKCILILLYFILAYIIKRQCERRSVSHQHRARDRGAGESDRQDRHQRGAGARILPRGPRTAGSVGAGPGHEVDGGLWTRTHTGVTHSVQS